MSGRARLFLDTNILVYTFDSRVPEKRRIARGLVEEALTSRRGVISYQVVQEFLNVATTRFESPMTAVESADYLVAVLAPLCRVHSSIGLAKSALEIRERWQLSYYDALIISAALEAGCRRILSEDLQHGLAVREATVENPFR